MDRSAWFHNAVSSRLSAERLADRLIVMRLNPAFDDVPQRDLEALAGAGRAMRHATPNAVALKDD
jgi:hypothetical protein